MNTGAYEPPAAGSLRHTHATDHGVLHFDDLDTEVVAAMSMENRHQRGYRRATPAAAMQYRARRDDCERWR